MSLAIELGIFVKNLYDEKPATFKQILVTGFMHRSVVMCVYNLITKDGSVLPIEKLSVDEKKKWWEDAKKLADGRLDNDTCIELSKSLYTLELLSQQ